MPHDSSKVLLGQVPSSAKEVKQYASDPASFPAGLAVSLASTGVLSLLKSAGRRIGISIGKSLSNDSKCTSVCLDGLDVPLLITRYFASLVVGDLTFTAVDDGGDGNDITVALVDSVEAGSETVAVTGTHIVVQIDDGESTAQQIYDCLVASDDVNALVEVAIADGEASSAQSAAAEDNLTGGQDPGDWIVVGAHAYTNDTTGKAADADDAGVTVSNAVYRSAYKTALLEDGTEDKCVLVDLPGGI